MQGQATQIIHAYRQAPWRVQRQWVGAFLLFVIGSAMIARDAAKSRAGGIGLDLRVYQGVNVFRAECFESDLVDPAKLQIAPSDGKA